MLLPADRRGTFPIPPGSELADPAPAYVAFHEPLVAP